VLLGGAGLAGMGERVRAITGLPVWDCVEAAQQSLQHTLATVGRRAAVA
jgi:Asp/Glu/hydantoin racemase